LYLSKRGKDLRKSPWGYARETGLYWRAEKGKSLFQRFPRIQPDATEENREKEFPRPNTARKKKVGESSENRGKDLMPQKDLSRHAGREPTVDSRQREGRRRNLREWGEYLSLKKTG